MILQSKLQRGITQPILRIFCHICTAEILQFGSKSKTQHTVTVVAEHLLLDKVQGRVDDAAAVTNARGGGLVQAEGERRNSNMLLDSSYVTRFIL